MKPILTLILALIFPAITSAQTINDLNALKLHNGPAGSYAIVRCVLSFDAPGYCVTSPQGDLKSVNDMCKGYGHSAPPEKYIPGLTPTRIILLCGGDNG